MRTKSIDRSALQTCPPVQEKGAVKFLNFGDNLPASTLVEVKGLVDPRMKVEIECQAYVE